MKDLFLATTLLLAGILLYLGLMAGFIVGVTWVAKDYLPCTCPCPCDSNQPLQLKPFPEEKISLMYV